MNKVQWIGSSCSRFPTKFRATVQSFSSTGGLIVIEMKVIMQWKQKRPTSMWKVLCGNIFLLLDVTALFTSVVGYWRYQVAFWAELSKHNSLMQRWRHNVLISAHGLLSVHIMKCKQMITNWIMFYFHFGEDQKRRLSAPRAHIFNHVGDLRLCRFFPRDVN